MSDNYLGLDDYGNCAPSRCPAIKPVTPQMLVTGSQPPDEIIRQIREERYTMEIKTRERLKCKIDNKLDMLNR
uniref:Branchpoint-bridging protein n=1 Tax=Ascaris lumbricoides TaxID=6252 RepID=A0A0M3HNI3_ASCLU